MFTMDTKNWHERHLDSNCFFFKMFSVYTVSLMKSSWIYLTDSLLWLNFWKIRGPCSKSFKAFQNIFERIHVHAIGMLITNYSYIKTSHTAEWMNFISLVCFLYYVPSKVSKVLSLFFHLDFHSQNYLIPSPS